jgi:small subunit ribosomal protein S6
MVADRPQTKDDLLATAEMVPGLEPKGGRNLANRIYEIMYIVDPDTPADKIASLNEAVGKQVEKEGGTVVRMDDIGIRTLAYPINKKTEGHYVLFEINGSGQEIMELERRMRVNDMIMRYITVRVDEDRKKATKMQAKREARASRRAQFRKTEEPAETPGEAIA